MGVVQLLEKKRRAPDGATQSSTHLKSRLSVPEDEQFKGRKLPC